MRSQKYSEDIIVSFLKKHNIELNIQEFLPVIDIELNTLIELPSNIIEQIITDAYGGSNNIVKDISNNLQKIHSMYIGRVQKNQLKKYIDYRIESDFKIFENLIKEDFEGDINLKQFCDDIIKSYGDFRSSSVDAFLINLNDSINSNNKSRIQDYLIFIYSRLISLNESKLISLNDIFESNKSIIKNELKNHDFIKLQKFCNDFTKRDRDKAIRDFNFEYIKILETNGNHKMKNAVVYFNITQELFNEFNDKSKFHSYIHSIVRKAYDLTQNHKSFVVKVENIIYNDVNIKWEIYSNLTIHAEKFNKIEENRQYFHPEIILNDSLNHKYGIELSKSDLKLLSDYYKNKVTFDALKEIKSFRIWNSKEYVDDFKYIYTGFTFIDCYILLSKTAFENSKEVEFIENNNEILLIFAKHTIDDSKIPCPVCGFLKVSGNSYPEIGVKSWECKNPLCSSRSKTNRGKRYSERTIFMQNATYDFSHENIIPKTITKIWRKDVVKSWELDDLYRMIVKYYSFVDDTITIIDATDVELFKQISKSEKRNVVSVKSSEFVDVNDFDVVDTVFDDSNQSFITHFLYGSSKEHKISDQYRTVNKFDNKIKLIHGDSAIVLSELEANSIDNMVTSPPYYNAREYSQWPNLHSYLNDMYKIVVESCHALKPGGVFLFNIGDIFDNENIVVKSKMGEKRIPLGAYIILLFQKAGFELLDNVIWYKGEPQSNRHKNDGNYTPYYQRPANCYEHMFIFKKKGAKLCLNKNVDEIHLRNNLQKFIPVYKIGKGGVNRYGHTAPFPPDIPLFSIMTFTKEGELVLDPFSGSSTSPITAQKTNRIGIGIELNEDYISLSCEKAMENNIEIELFSDICQT